jgi:predicted lipoprotein with Yx(FWY)xxD motif
MGRRDMRFSITSPVLAGAALLAVAGCGADTSSSAGAGNSTSQAAPSSTTIKSATVSGHGLVLVAGFNGMTLYQFGMDTRGSGTSACTGGCVSTWPPLTVPAGTTPTEASGITGQLATITRTDGKGIQVTYNGLPLHFYSGDTKAGDANGNYPGWSSVPVSGGGASAPSATPSGVRTPYGY